MSAPLNRTRFGRPQFVAALILIAFLGECIWFCSKVPLTDREVAFVLQGQREWQTRDISFHDQAAPVAGLLAALPVTARSPASRDVPSSKWAPRIPFMMIGVCLGASIWYVSRRLYGNSAGYIALILYAFSPLFVIQSSTVGPEIIGCWAAFGIIFTAIGVAHTLYAPREVVLWNWRRIILLGLALGVGGTARLGILWLLPIALALMFYLVPHRLTASVAILLSSLGLAILVLWALYGLHFSQLGSALQAAHLAEFRPAIFTQPVTWSLLGIFFVRQPSFSLLMASCIVVFLAWRHTRFFGTTAPLLLFVLLLLLGIGMPHQGGLFFYLIALPFGFVFVSGVIADISESDYAFLSFGITGGVLLGHILVSITGLARM